VCGRILYDSDSPAVSLLNQEPASGLLSSIVASDLLFDVNKIHHSEFVAVQTARAVKLKSESELKCSSELH